VSVQIQPFYSFLYQVIKFKMEKGYDFFGKIIKQKPGTGVELYSVLSFERTQ